MIPFNFQINQWQQPDYPEEEAALPVGVALPVEQAALPVEQAALPVEQAALPVEQAALPVEQAALPVEQAALPVEQAHLVAEILIQMQPFIERPIEGPID